MVSGKFDIGGSLSISLININYTMNNISVQVVNAIINHYNESENELTTITTNQNTDTTIQLTETTTGHAVATVTLSIWMFFGSTFMIFVRY